MLEIRRPDDDELCGFVALDNGLWRALTVFGGLLGAHATRDDAQRQVLNGGLSSLAERWTLFDAESGDEQIVCIQEADPEGVTVALDYYSLPGVPTVRRVAGELSGGRWTLRR